MDALGLQSSKQFFAIRDPMLSASRKGVPADLERRLQQAWLESKLNNSKSSEGVDQTEDEAPALPPSRRIKADLTNTLERLWSKTQEIGNQSTPSHCHDRQGSTNTAAAAGAATASGNQGAASFRGDLSVGSALSASTDVQVESRAGAEEAIWLGKMQALEPVPLGADYVDEDFFRGLEGLNDAFNELEDLLPIELPAPNLGLGFGDLDDLDDISVADYLVADGPQAREGEAFLSEPQQHGQANEPPVNDTGLSRDGPGLGTPADPEKEQAPSQGSHRKRKAAASSVPDRGAFPQASAPGASEVGHVLAPLDRGSVPPNPTALLVSIAQDVAAGNLARVQPQLAKLGEMASIYGNATQRLSAYFLEGLVARVTGSEIARHTAVPVELTDPQLGLHLMRSFEVLISASPYLTFGHMACNCAILDAFEGHDRVHIIDFGIGYGIQWPSLIQALASRPGGPPQLRITGVDLWVPDGVARAHCIVTTGRRLQTIAELWKVPLNYEAVRSKLEEVQARQISILDGEAVAVNCALRLHSLLDETVTPSNPRSAVLRTIRELKPDVLTIVEQNTDHNSPFFLSRFYEALHYYTAMFESIESSMPDDSRERRLFEQQVLGRAIVNVVACEGRDRVERQEPLGQWQRRVRRAGFVPSPLSASVVGTVEDLLATYKEGYGLLQEDAASLTLNWKGRPLLAMSAWTCDGPT